MMFGLDMHLVLLIIETGIALQAVMLLIIMVMVIKIAAGK